MGTESGNENDPRIMPNIGHYAIYRLDRLDFYSTIFLSSIV